MKEVTVTPVCDWHEDGERVIADQVRIISIDGAPREVDVCDVCDKRLDEFRALYARGVKPTKQAPAAPKRAHKQGRFACGFERPDGSVCKFRTDSEQGMSRHRTVQKHPMSDTLSSLGASA